MTEITILVYDIDNQYLTFHRAYGVFEQIHHFFRFLHHDLYGYLDNERYTLRVTTLRQPLTGR